MEDVEVVALCDVDRWRLEVTEDRVMKAYDSDWSPGKIENVFRTMDFREVLARDDIDAVMISTPDHWHVDERGRPVLTFRGRRIALPLVGRHQGDNAMVALAVAADLELDLTAVAGALERVALPHGRCEVITAGDLVLIDDTYNANPASFSAALEVARSLRGNRPLVTLVGTMLELGSESPALHDQMAEQILALGPDLIGAVGEFAAVFERRPLGARLIVAPDADALGRAVAPRLKGGELVLLKASRGVQLEKAIAHLMRGREASCSTTS